MSFFHQTSAGTTRARRTKEREGHPRASSVSNTGRRHGTSSKTQDNRSPPSKSPVLQNSIYSQQNLMLNQIPGTPIAEASTSAPISPTSSILLSNNHRNGGIIHLAQQPYTPIALQQYLDEDQGDDDDDDGDDDDEEEHQGGRSKNEKKDSRLPDAATMVVDTDSAKVASTITEKPQARRSLDQKDSPRSAITESGDSFYKVNSINADENSDSTNRDGKRVSDTIRDMTPSKDHNNAIQQVARVNGAGTESLVNNTVQTTPEKSDGHNSKPISKSSNEAMRLVSEEPQRKPLSQFTNGMNLSPVDYENTELQAAMMRTTSHQSAPFATRTFTPPAPPLGSNRAPTQASPIFLSPIPLRSHVTNDSYTTSYAPPPHYQSYQPPSNPIMSENYPNHSMFQDYTDFSYPPPPTLYSSIHNAAQSALPETQITQQYSQGDQNDNPLMLISKLLSALPELQMFIIQCQQAGLDGGSNLLSLRGPEQQSDENIKYRALEEKIEKDEQMHKEEILTLRDQISDLQARLRYVESDLADSKKTRDDLYEQLVMQRLESASTIKVLLSEKDDLQKRCDDAYIIAEKKTEEQVLAIHKEMEREKDHAKELEAQIEQHRTNYKAKEHEMNRASDQKHNELMESHKQVVQDLEARLEREVVKGSTLVKQMNELDQKLEQDRRCLTDQFDHDKKMITKTFEEKISSLRGEIRMENTRNSRSKEENAKLVKELGDIRKIAASDRTRFQELAQSFQDAACKINQENTNLQKTMTACGAMIADLQNRNNG